MTKSTKSGSSQDDDTTSIGGASAISNDGGALSVRTCGGGVGPPRGERFYQESLGSVLVNCFLNFIYLFISQMWRCWLRYTGCSEIPLHQYTLVFKWRMVWGHCNLGHWIRWELDLSGSGWQAQVGCPQRPRHQMEDFQRWGLCIRCQRQGNLVQSRQRPLIR